jgi:hypothetical protein
LKEPVPVLNQLLVWRLLRLSLLLEVFNREPLGGYLIQLDSFYNHLIGILSRNQAVVKPSSTTILGRWDLFKTYLEGVLQKLKL